MLACKDITEFQAYLAATPGTFKMRKGRGYEADEVDIYSIAQVNQFLAFARMLAYKDVTELPAYLALTAPVRGLTAA